MGKASTNAGIHPYRKPDFQISLPSNKPGLPFSTKTPIFMETLVCTEYKDKNKKELYFKDEVEFDNATYKIEYDNRNYRWILNNGNKTIALREVYKKIILVKKCPARQNL